MRFGVWIASASCLLSFACTGEGTGSLESSTHGLTLAPIGEWKLENNALDTSGSGNDGTITEATFVDGHLRRALRFDGVNDSLDLGGAASLQFDLNEAFSTSLWVSTTPNNQNHALIGTAWAGPGWHVRITASNTVRFILVQNANTYRYVDSLIPLTTGYHHVATTWDGSSSMHVYIDGVDVSSTAQSSGTLTSITSTANVVVGTLAGTSAPFAGDIDQIRMFAGALTSGDVTELASEQANQVPAVTGGSATTQQDTPITITLTGTDGDNDPLTFAIATGPTNGTLGTITQLTPTSASVTYTPTTSFFGADSFTFTANDGFANSTPGTFSITVTQTNPPIGKVGEWLFEDNALDTSGNNNNGTVNGPVFVDGKVNRAMQFDGVNDSVTVGSASSLQFSLTEKISTSAWINSSLDGTNQAIIGNAWAGPGWHVRKTSANRVRFIVVAADHDFWYVDSTTTLSAGWHHVATTWNGSTARIYVDNVDVTGTAVTSGALNTIDSMASVTIGNLPDSNQPFAGILDQVRLYDVVLSASEIQTLYDEGANANRPPVANGSAVATMVNTALTITLTGSDLDGNSLTFAIVTGPTNGTLGPITQLSSTTASVTYTPNPSYTGTDSFTFKVNDGTVDSADATLGITISDQPSAVVGQWELEDDALDYSEFANDGTINGGATFIDGYVGRALHFDGVDDSMSVGNGASLQFGLTQAFSTSFWINPFINQTNRALIGNTWSGAGWHVRITNGNLLRFILVQNATTFRYVDSIYGIAPGNSGWHHIATTWDGAGNLKIYLDGVDVTGTVRTSGTLTSITNGGNVTIGALPGVSIPFLGDMDQIRLFNVALTSTEVTELYQETD